MQITDFVCARASIVTQVYLPPKLILILLITLILLINVIEGGVIDKEHASKESANWETVG